MAKFSVQRSSTSQIVRVFIQDTSKTDGSGLTGLTASSSGLVCYYTRTGDSTGAVAVTLTGTGTLGTFTSGLFKEVDSVNAPGEYELHVPNAVFAATGNTARVYLRGATNMAVTAIEFQLDAVNYQSNTSFIASVPSAVGAVTVGTNNDKSGYSLTSSERDAIAADILNSAVETGESVSQTLKHIRAILAGVSSENNGTITFMRKDGVTTAVTIQHGQTGSRTSSVVGTL